MSPWGTHQPVHLVQDRGDRVGTDVAARKSRKQGDAGVVGDEDEDFLVLAKQLQRAGAVDRSPHFWGPIVSLWNTSALAPTVSASGIR